MRIAESLRELPRGPRVVALGTFDGVHLGHRRLVAAAREEAERRGVRSTVVTFDPMPLEVLRPDSAPPRLSGLGRRAALIADLGIDELLVLRFDAELASLAPGQFVSDVLLGSVGAVHVVVGENYRFGRAAAGDTAELRQLGERDGFGVTAVPLLRVGDERVSSSWIRELVAKGEVEHAGRLLGRPAWLDGAVIRGEGRGKALGVPTANLGTPPNRVVPAVGIYAGVAVLAPGERRYAAAISVGRNPTFGDDRERSVEAYLLDFDEDIYGSPLRLEFHRFLRHELRFESVDELVAQMWRDIDEVRAAVGDLAD